MKSKLIKKYSLPGTKERVKVWLVNGYYVTYNSTWKDYRVTGPDPKLRVSCKLKGDAFAFCNEQPKLEEHKFQF